MSSGLEPVGAVLIVGLTMTVVCAWPMYKGWQRRSRYHLVRDTPTKTPETAAIGDTVLLTGTTRGKGEQVTAPLSGGDALLAAWSISEWQDENSQFKYWSPEARGLRSAAIQIGTGDNAVTVPARSCEGATNSTVSLVGYDAVTGFDIDDTLVEINGFDTTEDVPQAGDPPERFRDLERQVGLDEPDAGVSLIDIRRTHGTRRYREVIVEEETLVTIRGTVLTADQPDDDPVLSVPDDGPAIASDLGADTLEQRYKWSYWKLFYGSVGMILGMMLFAALALASG